MKKKITFVLFGLLTAWLSTLAETNIRPNATEKDAGLIEIQELTLTGVYKPVIGEMPYDEASLGDNVIIDFKCWSMYSKKYGDWDSMKDGDGKYSTPFEEGEVYMFYLNVLPKEGYKFAPNIKVFYNSIEIPDYEVAKNNTGKGIIKDLGILVISIVQDDLAGVEGIKIDKSEDDTPADIYNMQGIVVKRKATTDELNSLPSGLYIMRGKKFIVR